MKKMSDAVVQFAEDSAQNVPLFRQINREARRNPHSPYASKWVALLRGQVVAVADTKEEARRELRKRESNRFYGLLFEANGDYETTDYVMEVN
jgi:hypothetical protein